MPSIYRQRCRLGVSRAFAACFLFDGFCAAAITSSAFVASAFVLATVTLVVLGEAGSALAGRAIAFELMDAVVGNFELWCFAAQVLWSFFQEDRASESFQRVTLHLVFFSGDRALVLIRG